MINDTRYAVSILCQSFIRVGSAPWCDFIEEMNELCGPKVDTGPTETGTNFSAQRCGTYGSKGEMIS